MPSIKLDASEKLLSTTQVASEAIRTNHTAEDQATGKVSNENRMSTTSCEIYCTSQESYFNAIQEMYPEMNVHRLSSHLIFYENWATVRASAGLKAFMAVKNMITEKKIVYSTSYSDDDYSDESVASSVQKKPNKTSLDYEDKLHQSSYLLLIAFCLRFQ